MTEMTREAQMTRETRAQLARCDAEIARCEDEADAGAALGWLDWNAEKLEIMKQLKARDGAAHRPTAGGPA